MRKKILAFVFGAALLVAMAVPLFGGSGTAFAKVDGVSQAGCAATTKSGGSESGSNSPDAFIPETASDDRHQGLGGAALAQGVNC